MSRSGDEVALRLCRSFVASKIESVSGDDLPHSSGNRFIGWALRCGELAADEVGTVDPQLFGRSHNAERFVVSRAAHHDLKPAERTVRDLCIASEKAARQAEIQKLNGNFPKNRPSQ